MNKKTNAKNNFQLISFWTLIGVFTIAFIIIVILMFVELRPIENYNDIDKADLTLVGDELFTNNEEEYFVYIYTSNKDNITIDEYKEQELDPVVFNYFNFVRQHSRKANVIKIYGFDVNNVLNRQCISNSTSPTTVTSFEEFQVNKSELPMLIHFAQGRIEYLRTKENDIKNELQTAMNKISNVNYDAILPKKEKFLLA